MFSSQGSFVPTPRISPLQHHASSAPVSQLNRKQWRQARQTNSVSACKQQKSSRSSGEGGRQTVKRGFEVGYLPRRTYCLLWFYFCFDKSQIEFSNITASWRDYFTFRTKFTIWVQNTRYIWWVIVCPLLTSPRFRCIHPNMVLCHCRKFNIRVIKIITVWLKHARNAASTITQHTALLLYVRSEHNLFILDCEHLYLLL